MSLQISKINPFSQSASSQGVAAGTQQAASVQSNNPFASNTVGVNTNLKVGDSSYVSNQLGKSGTARTLAFA